MADDDEMFDIDELADELSPEQKLMAAIRAFKTCGIPFELTGDSAVLEGDDLDGLEDNEEFQQAFAYEIVHIIVSETTRDLTQKGILEQVPMEDGTLGFFVTEDGEKIARELGIDFGDDDDDSADPA